MSFFKRNKIFICAVFLCFAFTQLCWAQAQSENDTDSTASKGKKALPPFNDSVFRFNVKPPNPKRAGLYSAILPGLGQVYNRQYWKLGVIVAAGGAVTGFMIFNNRKYNIYQKAYFGRIDNDPSTTDTFTNYQLSDLDLLRKTYRTYVEYTVIAGTLCYLINILDAFTSAHLKTFDMSKNISMRLSPVFDNRNQYGIRLAFAIK